MVCDFDMFVNWVFNLEMVCCLFVLLKNDGLLLFKVLLWCIVVIGFNVDSVDVLVGNYNGMLFRLIMLLVGLKVWFLGVCIDFVEGIGWVVLFFEDFFVVSLCVDVGCISVGLYFECFVNFKLEGEFSLMVFVL